MDIITVIPEAAGPGCSKVNHHQVHLRGQLIAVPILEALTVAEAHAVRLEAAAVAVEALQFDLFQKVVADKCI